MSGRCLSDSGRSRRVSLESFTVSYKFSAPLLGILFLTQACAMEHNPKREDTMSQLKDSRARCSVVESRNWHAWIDQVADDSLNPRLNIVGQVDTPTPGYEIVFTPGALDRRRPPSLRITLTAEPPDGIVTQVIDTQNVSFKLETDILEYRSIIVVCGDKQLAEMVGVTPTE